MKVVFLQKFILKLSFHDMIIIIYVSLLSSLENGITGSSVEKGNGQNYGCIHILHNQTASNKWQVVVHFWVRQHIPSQVKSWIHIRNVFSTCSMLIFSCLEHNDTFIGRLRQNRQCLISATTVLVIVGSATASFHELFDMSVKRQHIKTAHTCTWSGCGTQDVHLCRI